MGTLLLFQIESALDQNPGYPEIERGKGQGRNAHREPGYIKIIIKYAIQGILKGCKVKICIPVRESGYRLFQKKGERKVYSAACGKTESRQEIAYGNCQMDAAYLMDERSADYKGNNHNFAGIGDGYSYCLRYSGVYLFHCPSGKDKNGSVNNNGTHQSYAESGNNFCGEQCPDGYRQGEHERPLIFHKIVYKTRNNVDDGNNGHGGDGGNAEKIQDKKQNYFIHGRFMHTREVHFCETHSHGVPVKTQYHRYEQQ
jgi:hypothetical protein